MIEEVILVDEKDREIGKMEKLEAHQKGLLHRAISVFIFNENKEMLLQKRAMTKYHSPGLWTNTCCSHPRVGETALAAASRRLFEEMGIKTELQFKTTFMYRSEFDNGLIEHEFDHVFTGTYNAMPQINPDEVDSFCWMSKDEIKKEISLNPEAYTTWFRIAIRDLF